MISLIANCKYSFHGYSKLKLVRDSFTEYEEAQSLSYYGLRLLADIMQIILHLFKYTADNRHRSTFHIN